MPPIGAAWSQRKTVDLEKNEGEGGEGLVGCPPGHSLRLTSFLLFEQEAEI